MSEDPSLPVLQELLAWTKVQALPAARAALQQTLQKPDHRRVYQASTGAASTAISKETGVSDFTVREVWKRCFRTGLMREDPKVPGRYLRSFDLEDFDMAPPKAVAKVSPPEAPANG